MDEYLSTTVSKLKSNNYNELNLVLGNESCDLDSAVSALVYATFLHWQYSQIKCKACTGKYRDDTYRDDIFVPILDVERKDYPLKTEVAYSLRNHGIEDRNLVFKDDINIEVLLSKGKVNVFLVDQHVLSPQYEQLSPYVTEIIDHRPVSVSPVFNDVRTFIQIVGSCCTLVTERIKHLANLFAKDSDFFNMYPVTADLLHDVIIVDTVNFSKEVKKATPLDEEIILYLESIIKPENYQQERLSKLTKLLSARSDVSSLTRSQLLRKDLKILEDIFIPSFPILVKEFLAEPDALSSVTEALHSYNCSTALLLGMSVTSEIQRDGAIVSTHEEKVTQLSEFLAARPALGVVGERGPGWWYFTQHNLAASRKQYMELLTQFKHFK